MMMDGRRADGISSSISRISLVTDTVKTSRSAKDAARGEGSGESTHPILFGLPPKSRHSCVSDVVNVCGRESDDADSVPVDIDSDADVEELEALECDSALFGEWERGSSES